MLKCEKCGAENDSAANFCKSCGVELTKSSIVSSENDTSKSRKGLSTSFIFIFPIVWTIGHIMIANHGIVIPETIGEALGGFVVILFVPLIITSLIYVIKKAQSIFYINFVKHTFIGTVIMFAMSIASLFND